MVGVIYSYMIFPFWIISLIVVLILAIYAINKKMSDLLNRELIKQRSLRNLDYLLLGSTRVWKQGLKEDLLSRNIISFAFFKRNLLTDFIVLKHKFSYLKENGTVIVTIDLADLGVTTSEKVYISDLRMMHRITRHDLGFNNYFFQLVNQFPLIFYPGFLFGLAKTIKRSTLNYETGTKPDVFGNQIRDYIVSILSRFIEFCCERKIHLKVVFIDESNENREVISLIKSQLLEPTSYYDGIYSVLNVEDLYRTLDNLKVQKLNK